MNMSRSWKIRRGIKEALAGAAVFSPAVEAKCTPNAAHRIAV